MPYQITEPHPTAHPNSYMHTGRGGAGNTFKVKASSSRSQPTAPLAKISTSNSSSSSKSGRVSTGRGGAANIRASEDIIHYSLDEELAQQTREQGHDVWHVGRGGAGNWGSKQTTSSSRKLSNESASSSDSGRSGFFGRLSGVFDRA